MEDFKEKFKTFDERQAESKATSESIKRHREERRLNRKIDEIHDRKKKIVLCGSAATVALLSTSLVFAISAFNTKPTDVSFDGLSVTRIHNQDDYRTDEYLVNAINGKKFDLSFETLDEKVPRTRESQNFINLGDEENPHTAHVNRIEDYPFTRVMTFTGSLISLMVGCVNGGLTIKRVLETSREEDELRARRNKR